MYSFIIQSCASPFKPSNTCLEHGSNQPLPCLHDINNRAFAPYGWYWPVTPQNIDNVEGISEEQMLTLLNYYRATILGQGCGRKHVLNQPMTDQNVGSDLSYEQHDPLMLCMVVQYIEWFSCEWMVAYPTIKDKSCIWTTLKHSIYYSENKQ